MSLHGWKPTAADRSKLMLTTHQGGVMHTAEEVRKRAGKAKRDGEEIAEEMLLAYANLLEAMASNPIDAARSKLIFMRAAEIAARRKG